MSIDPKEFDEIKKVVKQDIPRAFVGLDRAVKEMSAQIDTCRKAIESLKKDMLTSDCQLHAIQSAFAEADLFNRSSAPSTLDRRRNSSRQTWIKLTERVVEKDLGVSYINLKTRSDNPVISKGIVIESIPGGDA